MIDFKKVTLQDKEWMDKLIKSANYHGSNFNFSNIYLWDKTFSQSVAQIHNFLVIKHEDSNHIFYAVPLGNGNMENVIIDLKKDCDKCGKDFVLKGLLESNVLQLKELFPDKFEFISDRDRFDYVYDIEKLCSLSGKKLQSKRNHINKFTQEYEWSFEIISDKNIEECIEMNDEWFSYASDSDSEHPLDSERLAISRAFKHYFELDLEGGLIRANGHIVAYSLGEHLTEDMYVIHFEKAFKSIDGAYPIINREFARYIFNRYSKIRYINREEDIGLEGLRKAKLSYRPDFFVEKYTAKYLR